MSDLAFEGEGGGGVNVGREGRAHQKNVWSLHASERSFLRAIESRLKFEAAASGGGRHTSSLIKNVLHHEEDHQEDREA